MKKGIEFVKEHRFYLILLLGVITATAFTFVIKDNASQNLNNVSEENELNHEPIYYERVAENTISDDEDLVDELQEDIAFVPESDEELNKVAQEMADIQEETEEEIVAPVFANANETKEIKQVEDNHIVINKAQLAFTNQDSILMPIKGQVFIGYDEKNPVYFKTLEHFRISKALFIRPNDSHDVKAVFDGKVKSISKDSVYGTLVEIDHGDGVISVYGQVNTKKMLKAGDFVKQGEIIGIVAEPTQFFIKEGKHLFFKMIKNEKAIDPMSLVLDE